jgi:serine/threonine-protein kinase RsbW
MSNRFFLKIMAKLEHLAEIYGFVRDTAATLSLDSADAYDLQLAVDEAVTNIIIHGYQGRGGKIEIEIEQDGDTLVVRLRDEAPPFDPTTVPPPDLTRPLAEQSPGGRGIHLMRQVMDEAIHQVTAGGGNELTLVKKGVVTIQADGGTDNAYGRSNSAMKGA